MDILIQGTPVSLENLRDDIAAARAHGLSGRWAFTPETVEALVNELERNAAIAQRDALLQAARQAHTALLDRKPFGVPGGEQACEALRAAIVAAEQE